MNHFDEPLAIAQLLHNAAPPFDTPCVCGRRYGMHRVNDYACPNQRWVPGNGQPQWLVSKFQREAAAPSAAQPGE